MIHINGQADQNDIKHAEERTDERIVAVQPCPISDYDSETNVGKINPHATKFTLESGKYMTVFHVKPIYYETLEGEWRPMEEVALGFGNTWIDFKGDWHTKMHPRYMDWLQKRMVTLESEHGINIAERSPYGVPITVEQKELVTVK